jgi:hypothetical protein
MRRLNHALSKSTHNSYSSPLGHDDQVRAIILDQLSYAIKGLFADRQWAIIPASEGQPGQWLP